MQAVLWNERAGAWFDYDLINKKPRPYYTSTNLAPLMHGCYNTANKSAIARKILAYIDLTGIDAFPGGIPTTFMQTGEQWDYPNAWPPLQQWLYEGLRTLDDKEATDLANKWTNRKKYLLFVFEDVINHSYFTYLILGWTLSNYIAYKETNAMLEKVILSVFFIVCTVHSQTLIEISKGHSKSMFVTQIWSL